MDLPHWPLRDFPTKLRKMSRNMLRVTSTTTRLKEDFIPGQLTPMAPGFRERFSFGLITYA
jgi:hypothetical protein